MKINHEEMKETKMDQKKPSRSSFLRGWFSEDILQWQSFVSKTLLIWRG
jgi:hypothetical protein